MGSRTALTSIQKHFRGIYDLQGERAELCVAEIVLIELIFLLDYRGCSPKYGGETQSRFHLFCKQQVNGSA